MATLVSPGVSISVTDESFYAPAGAGTVPLIVIATAQDKTAPDGTSTAAYTTKANANKLYLITSQRELLQSYGNPSFKTSGGTPVHGDETNEYGLAAAYSFLGISNRAYILRADVDLGQLESSATAPSSAPENNTLWWDTASTTFGLKKWDGAKWTPQSANVKVAGASDVYANSVPKAAYGKDGEYAVSYYVPSGAEASSVKLFEKISGTWRLLGASDWVSAKGAGNEFQWCTHTTIPTTQSDSSPLVAGDLVMQTNTPNNGANIVVKSYSTATAQFVTEEVPFYSTAREGYDYYTNGAVSLATVPSGALLVDYLGGFVNQAPTANVKLKKYNGASTLTLQGTAITDTAISNSFIDASNVAFRIKVNNAASDVEVYLTSETNGNIAVDDIVADIQSALSSANVVSTYANQVTASNVSGKITLVNDYGRDLQVYQSPADLANTAFRIANCGLTSAEFSNFEAATYEAQATAVTGATANATLWYDADISTNNIDLLEHNGSTWVTLTTDFQTKATEPTTQSDGSSSLVSGDVWLDSSNTENLKLYKHDGTDWVLVDQTDQSTSDGIVFADFRQSASSSLDADAPDATLYPQGILGWNYRASGGNVKQWRKDYALSSSSTADVWVSYSGNAADGSGLLLRKAQRRAVTRAMQSAVVGNNDIRNETNRFNLAAAPGYAELADELLALSTDRKDTVFALIDPPLRLASTASAIQAWANNSNNAIENGEDGLVSSSSQAAVYYPSGLATNLDGTNIMVPASHMALRTYAYNDQVAFPWFAPAGFQRGVVNNATSVGYLDASESEFVPVSLNEGQRDTMYLNKVNPIATFPGRGISVFGQKTLNPTSSALDRVNVSRLVIYIREQLDDAVKPFLFEPNDVITRSNAKRVVDRILEELVTQRGLFDFVTVCDDSNNTPARIDRNELHIDIAIQPVKAVEFIYIPIRIQNTLGASD